MAAPIVVRSEVDEAAQQPASEAGRAHPDSTARQLRDFLKASGTGEQRIQAIDDMIRRAPGLSGKVLIEQMIGAGMQTGTVVKAGRFVYGPSFSLAQGGAAASTEELERLQSQNAELERLVRQLEGRGVVQGQEILDLRGENVRLKDEIGEIKTKLTTADAELVRLRDSATTIGDSTKAPEGAPTKPKSGR